MRVRKYGATSSCEANIAADVLRRFSWRRANLCHVSKGSSSPIVAHAVPGTHQSKFMRKEPAPVNLAESRKGGDDVNENERVDRCNRQLVSISRSQERWL